MKQKTGKSVLSSLSLTKQTLDELLSKLSMPQTEVALDSYPTFMAECSSCYGGCAGDCEGNCFGCTGSCDGFNR